ncbi:hypothetical protein P4G80_24815 [Bacillus cereus]|nr:hypothetical protein [Bacillus thuringiensis]MEB8884861.1 hypothetical protein [Bacillus cereus]MCC4002091.1 hypothetical protein [Bacillus thuringiensis]MEB8984229.1 hypothetical protein [Bacillus cereus]MEC2853952.1 hypothetical protein [Bacillus cereus]MEC3435899.1 hypothetical protein [Bacillus cereus]
MENKISNPMLSFPVFGCECWLGVWGLAPKNVIYYRISLSLGTIELGGSAGIITSPSRAI